MTRRPNASILSLLLVCLAAAPAGAQTAADTPATQNAAPAQSEAVTPAAEEVAPPASSEAGTPVAPVPSEGGEATAAPGTTANAPEENWAVNCAGEGEARRCSLLQNLVAQQGEVQQRLLTVLIQPDGNGGETLLLALPHGLFLPAGAQIQVDGGEPQKLVIQTSDQNGSYAGIALEPELLASLRRGRELKVSFLSAQQQAATVPVTLVGFSAAYDRMRQEIQAN